MREPDRALDPPARTKRPPAHDKADRQPRIMDPKDQKQSCLPFLDTGMEGSPNGAESSSYERSTTGASVTVIAPGYS